MLLCTTTALKFNVDPEHGGVARPGSFMLTPPSLPPRNWHQSAGPSAPKVPKANFA